jgi:beta-glucosidase-like glycosyl hydrolase/CubicO group peptidase (beta-lactamase class C family)
MARTGLRVSITVGVLCLWGIVFLCETLAASKIHRASEPLSWADSVMKSLTIEERIAQMIMVAVFPAERINNIKEVERLVREQKIGGLVFFQGAPFKQAVLTNYFQSLAVTPLLVAMDAEQGLGMRLDSTIRYPRQMALGASVHDTLVYEMGCQIAAQLKRIGVHINFAPVADINSNPANPVINSRSFGEQPDRVTAKSLMFMQGMESGGIMAVAKHFPGHGDTDSDSHDELPYLRHSYERLWNVELSPYKTLIKHGISGIMAAHLHIPSLDSRENIPSSLSAQVIDSLLRRKMGFNGLVFTDALGMRGVSAHYTSLEAAIMALKAGNDVLLMPENVDDLIAGIARLVIQGEIDIETINRCCKRILDAKKKTGLEHYHPVDLHQLYADLQKPEYQLLLKKLTEESLTLVQNHNQLLPLQRLDTLNLASLTLSAEHDTVFQQMLTRYSPVDAISVSANCPQNTDSLLHVLSAYNMLIVDLHSQIASPDKQFGIHPDVIRLIDTLATTHPIILNLFVSPYILRSFANLNQMPAVLVCYENSQMAQKLAAQAVYGAVPLQGKLPVTLSQKLPYNCGNEMPASGRLSFAEPAEASMKRDTLDKIDLLIREAIQNRCMPGCQILVARKGMIVYNRVWGAMEYGRSHSVCEKHLYDLASITKPVATTLALMRLVEEGQVELDQKLSFYLPYLARTNKRNLIIRDVLLHQAGLVPTLAGIGHLAQKQKGIYSGTYSSQYPLSVTENLFANESTPDSIYKRIAHTKTFKKKSFIYSDLGFILLKQLVDSVTKVSFDYYLDSVFYKRLGAARLCFNPLSRFSRREIAPTENDLILRHQQIQGYVHDPVAAMMGGIAGHAGLFGNALDLAKVLQMLLNGGNFGGEQYLKPQTIREFTESYTGANGNRRGLGFDKPEPDAVKVSPACPLSSSKSYGHSGFTGTYFWVDPAYELLYIFLSNRIYPDVRNNKLVEENIRTRVQDIVYCAIEDL